MNRFELCKAELKSIDSLLQTICGQYDSVEDVDFLHEATNVAHCLPRRLCSFLNDFRVLEESPGYCTVSGYPINGIGPTPSHWAKAEETNTRKEEFYLILLGSLLGDVFAWATQQDGRIMHNVLPIRGHEHEQLGSSSKELLTWHTEDAFHPYRGDYLGLMCMRNPNQAATTVACVSAAQLEESQTEILFEPRFTIRPDESHKTKNLSEARRSACADDEQLQKAYRRIEEMQNRPVKIPLLFGSPESPYLRIDPYFMNEAEFDAESADAYRALVNSIERALEDLILQPGEVCFIDNYRVVHGRKPFKANYDGRDRWLKRISITRDLRKSRDYRAHCKSRVIM